MKNLRKKLIETAKNLISDNDPSHDFDHAYRVLMNAERIATYEGGDLKVLIPAALFHDVVNYQKDDPRARYAAERSAHLAGNLLKNLREYSEQAITAVKNAILEHSYSKGLKPSSLESKILQDADRLEATGAVAIMRTFSSSGQMKRKFYNNIDPFCKGREPGKYAVDLFYQRLLNVGKRMNTNTARKLAETRTAFLYNFLDQLEGEIYLYDSEYLYPIENLDGV